MWEQDPRELYANSVLAYDTIIKYVVDIFFTMSSNTNTQQSGGQEDYLDKGLDQAEKKFGGAAGQDSQKNRAVNEKVVSLRTWYESIRKQYI